jgi:predicted ABC-type sugar transport system permease subunit
VISRRPPSERDWPCFGAERLAHFSGLPLEGEAARAAGINVGWVIWSDFNLATQLAGLAGVLTTGRLGSAVTTQSERIIF